MIKFSITTILLFAVITMSVNAKLTTFGGSANAGLKPKGGLSASKPVDDEVTELVNRLKPDIIKKICDNDGVERCPTSDAKIEIKNYKTQTVSGTNYFVGFNIGDITYHARIYSQPWTHTEEVHSVQGPKQANDEITYFV